MDYYKLAEKRSITPEKLVKILDKHGTVVGIEKAKKILELVYKLSNLSVKETLTRLAVHNPKAGRRKFTRHTRKKKENEDS
jgi:hypothetical protein